MKKSILNLGKTLNKAEQKQVTGGMSLTSFFCESVCKTASRGTRCYSPVSGQSACNGNGGHIPF